MSLPAHWVNLEPGDRLSSTDRGFRYGDGLFETLRFGAAGFHLPDYHLARLERGCARLGIACERERISEQLRLGATFLADENIDEAYARLTVSRGADACGYAPTAADPTIALSLTEARLRWRDYLPPAELILCETGLSMQPALAGIKHGNRLEQVLAAREVAAAGADEGLLCNARGEVVCAVSANLFAVFDGAVVTPPVFECGVAGTVRRLLIEELAAAAGVRILEAPVTPADLRQALELFLTNALIGIRSVAVCAGRRFTSTATADTLRELFFRRSDTACR